MINSNPNEPTFIFDNLPLHWQMTRCEKYAFASLVQALKPEIAIEIGTYKGGSLQILSKVAKKIYSIDISPKSEETLNARFNNVEFLVGDSKQLLSPLLKKIAENNESLSLILIDGNHSTEGVKNDINTLLQFIPNCPVYIVSHDSFYPPCRKGILSADWHGCQYIHYVEVDFIPGVYHYKAFDTAKARSMYGGLSLALMLPEKRIGGLTIHQSQRALFDIVLPHSCHGFRKYFSKSMIKGLTKKLLG